MHVRRSLVSAGLLVGLGAFLPIGTAPAQAQGALMRAAQAAPSGLSGSGRALWDLESLLRRVYGSDPVWADAQDPRGVDFDCAGQMCGPLASYDPYFYTFDNPTGTAFHIASSQYTDFGNYPVPVFVHGHNVACDAGNSQFLVNYSDAAISSLGCVGPLSSVTSPITGARATQARFNVRLEDPAVHPGPDPESVVVPFRVTNTGTAPGPTWCGMVGRTAGGTEVTSSGPSEVASSLAPGETLSGSLTILLVWTNELHEPTLALRCAASALGVFAGRAPWASGKTPHSVVTSDLALQTWRARNFIALNQLEADLYPHYGLLSAGTSYDCGQLGADLITALHLAPPSYRPLAQHWKSALDAVRGQLRNCANTTGTNDSFVTDAALLDDVVFEIQDS